MNILKDIRDFFFPRICVCCGRLLSSHEEGVCISCMASLPVTEIFNTPENEMERLFWGIFPIERAASLYYYARGSSLSRILHGMKYHGRKQLCMQMGRVMGTELMNAGFFDGIDFIVPVPLHNVRLAARGYNQSELLARGISEITSIPVAVDVMKRIHNNATQTHKSAFERRENAEGLFEITEKAYSLSGRHLLLIDDVLTTGATISACLDVLGKVDSVKISVVTLAWTKS